jgi:hypothetical protein
MRGAGPRLRLGWLAREEGSARWVLGKGSGAGPFVFYFSSLILLPIAIQI